MRQQQGIQPNLNSFLPSTDIHNYRSRVRKLTTNLPHSNSVSKTSLKGPRCPFNNEQSIINVYRSQQLKQSSDGTIPTIFMIQGSGFIANGSDEVADSTCSLIAELTGHQVINLHHRLAPEYIHPFPVLDCAKQVNFCNQNKYLNIDHKKVAGCGYSSGGFILAWLANLGLIQSQFYLFPLLDLNYDCCFNKDIMPHKDLLPKELLDDMIENYTNIKKSSSFNKSLSVRSPTNKLANNQEYKYIITGSHDRMAASLINFATKSKNTKLELLDSYNHFAPLRKKEVIETMCQNIVNHYSSGATSLQ